MIPPRHVRAAVVFASLLFFSTSRADCPIEVCFSPGGHCEDTIVAAISDAKTSIYCQAYLVNSMPIVRAIVAAKQRGCAVHVILDKSWSSMSRAAVTLFLNAGIDLKIDSWHNIAHNKVLILDAQWVLTGSYNFTSAANVRNAENLLMTHCPDLAAQYRANFDAHAAHSASPGATVYKFPLQK